MTSVLLGVCYAVLAVGSVAVANPSDLASVVSRIDETLSPAFEFSLVVVSRDAVADGEGDGTARYRMLARGRDATLLMTLEPARERGRNLLFDGLDVWVYHPKVRRPFSMTLRERLTTGVSIADLARLNFTRDYLPVAIETVAEEGSYVVELAANDVRVPYPVARVWVDLAPWRVHKAEFFSRSGRKLKSCWYRSYQDMLGRFRPTEIEIVDEVIGDRTLLEYREWKEEQIPRKFLDKSALDKLRY